MSVAEPTAFERNTRAAPTLRETRIDEQDAEEILENWRSSLVG
jgi:hypothetical protein